MTSFGDETLGKILVEQASITEELSDINVYTYALAKLVMNEIDEIR